MNGEQRVGRRRKKGRGRDHVGTVWTVEKRDGSKRYCGSVTVAPYRRKKVYADDLETLEQRMRDLKSAATRGPIAQPTRHTVESWLTEWIEDVIRPSRRETTTELYRGQIRNHIVPFIGKLKLAKLAPIHLQQLYARLEREERSPRMRQHVHLRLHAALRRAKRLGLIPSNPAEDVDAPTAPKRAMATLDADQVRKLLETARGERFEALYVLAITTGMRQGELLALRWRDLDLDARILVVQHSLARVRGQLKLVEPKTVTSRRRIDLPEMTVDALRRHHDAAKAHGRAVTDDSFVFPEIGGGPMRKENIVRRSFEPLLVKAGLPRIRFHDLRHTSASLLLASGTSVKVAQERLGLARASITLDVYAHTVRSMQREAAAFFDLLLAETASPEQNSKRAHG